MYPQPIVIRIVTVIAIISLWFSVTNFVPFSALLAGLVVLVPFLWFRQLSLSLVSKSLAVMLGYFLLSTILYEYSSLFEYDFYRRDGNVFITFAPLLLLPLVAIKLDPAHVTRLFIYYASAINIIMLPIYYITGGTLFIYEENIYHHLFVAHNAAGGFMGMLSALCIGYYVKSRRILFLLLSITNIWGLFATDSRGSILAFIAAAVLIVMCSRKLITGLVIGIIVLQLLILGLLYVNADAEKFMVREQFYQTEPQESQTWNDQEWIDRGWMGQEWVNLRWVERGWTIMVRGAYLYPKAIQLFFESPLVGTGFGSYNDMPYSFHGLKHVLQWNDPPVIIHSDAHAHHTFLHVLAETGIVGLLLLLYLLYRIKQQMVRIESPELQCALEIAFWFAIFSSFTEHRLFTPSQMLPFTILLGLAIANDQYRWNRSG